MVYPNFKNKHREEALVTPKKYIEYAKIYKNRFKMKAPKSVIFCYDSRVLDYILSNFKIIKDENFRNFYLFSKYKNIGIIGNFGVGGPVTGIYFEELIAWGVKNCLSIGTAGCLQEKLDLGSLVVVDRAIRDEGTSSHYIPHSKYASPSKTLTNKLEKVLKKLKLKYTVGTTWTIDAPYRETKAEVKKYKKEGVLTVEMEAAALFAIAKCRKVNVASIITVSDHLCELEWKPNFHLVENNLKQLVNISIDVLK